MIIVYIDLVILQTSVFVTSLCTKVLILSIKERVLMNNSFVIVQLITAESVVTGTSTLEEPLAVKFRLFDIYWRKRGCGHTLYILHTHTETSPIL